MSKFYVYKLVADNGGAPCVQNGLLSLAICKPRIRRSAHEGDFIFGFGAKNYGERLLYIACITEKLNPGDYYREKKFMSRADCIYKDMSGQAKRRDKPKYHSTGEHLKKDVGMSFENAHVLLSRDFRYLGKKGTDGYKVEFPKIAELMNSFKRNHRVNFSPDVYSELQELRLQIWKKFPENFNSVPTDSDCQKNCNE